MSIEPRRKREKLPFDLMPTSIEGVYSFVPPPKGIDLRSASRRTLLKHGILMRRPDPEKEPRRFALWSRFLGEIYTEGNFVSPIFGPQQAIPHNLKGLRPAPDGGYVSDNMFGSRATRLAILYLQQVLTILAEFCS